MPLINSIVPILHINKAVNVRSLARTLQTLQKMTKYNIAGIGLVVNIPNYSPVVTDTMVQSLKQFRQVYNVPILGFTYQHVTLQSYYLLSVSDKIYTYPQSIYKLRLDNVQISMDNLYKKLNLQKKYHVSNYKMFQRLLDMFAISPQQSTYFELPSYQNVDIGQRIFKQAIKNRRQFHNITEIKRNKNSRLQSESESYLNQSLTNKSKTQQLPFQDTKDKIQFMKLNYNSIQSVLMGKEVLDYNLVDGYGYYQEILRKQFPNSIHHKLHYHTQNKSITRIIFFITSPIIIIVFLIKVAVKWSIIFYAWIKAKTMKMAGIQPDVSQSQGQDTNTNASH